MEAKQRPPPVQKKPPLTDMTNNFTVPTSVVLRKLKSSLSSTKPPNPNPNSISSPIAKILAIDCSDSETSIGSSSFNNICPNPSSRSTPNRGNKRGNSVEPVYRRNKVTEKTKDEGEKTSMPLTIYLETSMPLTIYSDEKRTVKGKSAAVPTGKIKDTQKRVPIPVSCTSMVNTRNKTKENVEPFSCPPLPRTRKRSAVLNEAVNICISHSFSAPPLNDNKKKSRLLVGEDDSENDLPQEFVEQQRAYFKEIDDFELAEEEVSENEFDNDDTSRETLTN